MHPLQVCLQLPFCESFCVFVFCPTGARDWKHCMRENVQCEFVIKHYRFIIITMLCVCPTGATNGEHYMKEADKTLASLQVWVLLLNYSHASHVLIQVAVP